MLGQINTEVGAQSILVGSARGYPPEVDSRIDPPVCALMLAPDYTP